MVEQKKERGFRVDMAALKKMSDADLMKLIEGRPAKLKAHRAKMDKYIEKYNQTHEKKKAKYAEEAKLVRQLIAERKAKPAETAKA